MSTRPDWRQLTLFDDHEVAIPVSIETPSPATPTFEPVDHVPAIDVSRVRRRKPANQPELDGLH